MITVSNCSIDAIQDIKQGSVLLVAEYSDGKATLFGTKLHLPENQLLDYEILNDLCILKASVDIKAGTQLVYKT